MLPSTTIFISILSLLLVASCGSVCPTYQCNVSLGETFCTIGMDIDGTAAAILSPCRNKSTFCDLASLVGNNAVCRFAHSEPVLYPGEYCRTGAECLSKICNGTCIGAYEGQGCETDDDCGPALFCGAGICQKVAEKGQYCNSEQKCDSTSVCNLHMCTRKGSLKVGNSSETPGACESFYMSEGGCVRGPVLVPIHNQTNKANLTVCPAEGQCAYEVKDQDSRLIETFTRDCVCGFTGEGKRFCDLGKGDVDMKSVYIFPPLRR